MLKLYDDFILKSVSFCLKTNQYNVSVQLDSHNIHKRYLVTFSQTQWPKELQAYVDEVLTASILIQVQMSEQLYQCVIEDQLECTEVDSIQVTGFAATHTPFKVKFNRLDKHIIVDSYLFERLYQNKKKRRKYYASTSAEVFQYSDENFGLIKDMTTDIKRKQRQLVRLISKSDHSAKATQKKKDLQIYLDHAHLNLAPKKHPTDALDQFILQEIQSYINKHARFNPFESYQKFDLFLDLNQVQGKIDGFEEYYQGIKQKLHLDHKNIRLNKVIQQSLARDFDRGKVSMKEGYFMEVENEVYVDDEEYLWLALVEFDNET